MNNLFLKMYVKFQELKDREEGQDLVEYALLVSLIALAAITGVKSVTSAITQVFTNISTSIA
jgi:pilus assembly protein Flp/PilA